MSERRTGAQLYTVRASTKTIKDLASTAKRVAAMGYTGVEIDGGSPLDAGEVGQAIGDAGLAILAAHVGWPSLLDDADAVIDAHRTWGCSRVGIPCLPGDYYSAEGIQRFLDEFPPVSDRLAAAGLECFYHNHSLELARYGDRLGLDIIFDGT